MTVRVATGIDARTQESSFMNATLQGVSDTHAISLAVHLPEGAAAGVDLDDADAVSAWLGAMFASAIEGGCEIEAQVGPETADVADGEDGEDMLPASRDEG